MRIKWEPKVVDLVASPLSKSKKKLLLAEIGRYLYTYICQLHQDRIQSVSAKYRSFESPPFTEGMAESG